MLKKQLLLLIFLTSFNALWANELDDKYNSVHPEEKNIVDEIIEELEIDKTSPSSAEELSPAEQVEENSALNLLKDTND